MGPFTLKLSVTAMDAAVLTFSYDFASCAGMDSARGEYGARTRARARTQSNCRE